MLKIVRIFIKYKWYIIQVKTLFQFYPYFGSDSVDPIQNFKYVNTIPKRFMSQWCEKWKQWSLGPVPTANCLGTAVVMLLWLEVHARDPVPQVLLWAAKWKHLASQLINTEGITSACQNNLHRHLCPWKRVKRFPYRA